MPKWEYHHLNFTNHHASSKKTKFFLRDFSQSWYQQGLPGIGNTVFDIGRFIETKIKQINPDETFFVGNSMGGYAAILFAAMLQCGKAIAFCPQTFISPIKRLIYRDLRWSRQILKTYKATMLRTPSPIYDLKKLLSRNGSRYTAEVFVSLNDKVDLVHAKRIEKFKNVYVYKYDIAGHNLVKYLRDQDQLQTIMEGKRPVNQKATYPLDSSYCFPQ